MQYLNQAKDLFLNLSNESNVLATVTPIEALAVGFSKDWKSAGLSAFNNVKLFGVIKGIEYSGASEKITEKLGQDSIAAKFAVPVATWVIDSALGGATLGAIHFTTEHKFSIKELGYGIGVNAVKIAVIEGLNYYCSATASELDTSPAADESVFVTDEL